MYERKWNTFLKRLWPFRFIPFVDFVFASGSLATGRMHENSDFDVIVGVRQGRIFTARFFTVGIFRLLRWGRKHSDSEKFARNKICLNHFVTPSAYRLAPPYNEYWKLLYSSLVPVYGAEKSIQSFWDANQDWMNKRKIYTNDTRHRYKNKISIQAILEWMLGGTMGDWLEKILKNMQLRKIISRDSSGYNPRIIVNDNELEFHPDTRRTESYFDS
ncbi:MAG TPA: nucleotidyltransferase domain-containing protein [Candidatus Paceibacterota bacterium]